MSLTSFPPAALFILGALCLPFLGSKLRNLGALIVAALGVYLVHNLQIGQTITVPFMEYTLTVLRVDALSKVFGYIFTLTAFSALLYGLKGKNLIEPLSALMYMGSALGVVFAGDLITLYFYWEAMAVTSAFLVIASRTKSALAAGKRYILVHVIGGLILLAGIVLTIGQTGDISFNALIAPSAGHILILFGFLVNAAVFPFSSWLPDAYPKGSAFGSVVLSAFTSKTAVYALIRGFAGWEILIWLGCFTALITIVYAILENDIRRVLSFSIVNQVSFMVVAIGVGTPLALSAAAAHAFCHILYKSLLFMSTGAVIQQTGKHKFTELGGLAKSMPLTAFFCIIGALAIAAPFTIGFTGKPLVLIAVEKAHLYWPWLILEIASAAVIFHTALKVPYFIFFSKPETEVKATEAPKHMLVGMGIVAFFCILLGVAPGYLYDLLPDASAIKAVMPTDFAKLYFAKPEKILMKLQIIFFTAIAFFGVRPAIKSTAKITLDVDIVYRQGARLLYWVFDKGLNGLNAIADSQIRVKIISKIAAFFRSGPANILSSFSVTSASRQAIIKQVENSAFPIGLSALAIMVVTAIFLVL